MVIGIVLAVVATATANRSVFADAPIIRYRAGGRIGFAGDDDLQGGAFGPDGAIYLAGNAATPLPSLSGAHGKNACRAAEVLPNLAPADSPYGSAFVVRLGAEGRPDALAVFPTGRFFLTSVVATTEAVYAGGYFYPDEALLPSDIPRLTRRQGRHRDYGGKPAVFCLSPDLKRLLSHRVFEGGHFVWEVGGNLREFHWQPTDVALLPDGDIVVSVDGGLGQSYFFAPDRIVRLSPDLTTVRWEIEIAHPLVDPPSKVGRYWPEFRDWPHPAFGQTRILRLRADSTGRLAAAGWSPSKTRREPWWSPFLIAFDSEGRRLWQAYTVDPMSGGGNRLGGLVADSAIVGVAWDANGNLLFSGVSDGGNTILARDPLDYTRSAPALQGQGPMARRGRCLFYGIVGRLNGADGALLGGVRFSCSEPGEPGSAPEWAADLAALPDGGVLVVGRRGWCCPPEGFLRCMDAHWRERWTVPLRDVDPMTVTALGNTALVTGIAFGDEAPGPDGKTTAGRGGEDGWWMVFEVDR